MQRRSLLSLGAAAAASVFAPSVHSSPVASSKRATIVFVHGAWHGGWCFAPVVAALAREGFSSIAIDLPGHAVDAQFPAGYFDNPQDPARLAEVASPLGGITAEDFRVHVTSILEGLAAAGGPVVLVGHSLGGVTLNLIGERSPHLIRRLVYLTALMPIVRPVAGDYFGDPAMATSRALPLFIGDPAKTGAIRFNSRSSDPAFRAAAKNAFYGDVGDERFAAIVPLLTPDEPAAVFGARAVVTAQRWGRLPRTYVRCTEDQAIPVPAQDRFIAEADALVPRNRTTVATLTSSHSPFASMPEALARVLQLAAT